MAGTRPGEIDTIAMLQGFTSCATTLVYWDNAAFDAAYTEVPGTVRSDVARTEQMLIMQGRFVRVSARVRLRFLIICFRVILVRLTLLMKFTFINFVIVSTSVLTLRDCCVIPAQLTKRVG